MNNFKLGKSVLTHGVATAMHDVPGFVEFVWDAFTRYLKYDWGDTCTDDVIANAHAVLHDERILAVYHIPEKFRGSESIPDKSIWIITEADRSVTTVLFPSEY